MMEFIIMTLSFTMAILLASFLAFVIMLNPKVMKFYMKKMTKTMNDMDDVLYDEMAKDL